MVYGMVPEDYGRENPGCPVCGSDNCETITLCPCDSTVCDVCGCYDGDVLLCKRCAKEREEEREFLALGKARGAVLCEPTVPQLGQPLVREHWDGERWIETTLRWNGEQFAEVA